MSLNQLCKPRNSVFEQDRRLTVLNLDSFLKDQISGNEFFDENHFTNGMNLLLDRALRHLSGSQAGASVFFLSQAMGGGKTHSMIALGLLAKDPQLRKSVFGEKDPAPNLNRCRVIGFNGRNSDAPGGIWGSIAEQLGKAEQFTSYVNPMLKAPGSEAWKQLLGGDPVLIFLDELPPYLEYAVSVPVGNGDLGLVTSTALANLFVAVSEMDNVCLVISDLAGTNYQGGQQNLQASFERAVQSIASEANRIAVPITPVNPNDDELYHILRKRLFEETASEESINPVATSYRDSLREAHSMGLTATSPEGMYGRVLDSYPFHPDWRSLVGKFKANEGFQQTRGVIRLMQMIVSNLWQSGKADSNDLIHPYDLDLNVDEIASEVRAINPSLSEAIANDIAHNGDAEVEKIDEENRNNDASETAKLILVASLSTTSGGIPGLREHQLIECLQRPGRDLSTFKTGVLDKLGLRAWYLHNSSDGRLFFKNQQNLAAKLRSESNALHQETVERMLRERLEDNFSPSLRDCYQLVKVLPPLDEVQVDQEKTVLIIVKPGSQENQLPISQEWQNWWSQQQYKNRTIFLSGSRDTFQKVMDSARQSRALQSIEDELTSDAVPADDPQWNTLDALRDRIELQFSAALKEAFDHVVYPSINSALRSSGIDLAFQGNQSGEATIRQTLEAGQKFTKDIDSDSFRAKAEGRLFGSPETKVILWADFKRNAAVTTSWPLHKVSALDDLRADCIRKDIWREEGNHIRRGPFAPPEPSVLIRELSTENEGDGSTYLKIEPLHATAIVFETGNNDPTPSSSPVPNPLRFEAKGLLYKFLAYDPDNPQRSSEVKTWSATPRIKHQLRNRGDYHDLELVTLPKSNAIKIRYTTNGTSPSSATAATYDSSIKVPEDCRIILAIAIAQEFDLQSEIIRIPILQIGEEPQLDRELPARWIKRFKIDETGQVWNLIERLEKANTVKAFDINITAENTEGSQLVDFNGTLMEGYDSNSLKEIANSLQGMVGAGSLRITINSFGFNTGQDLLDWVQDSDESLNLSDVKQ